MYDFKEEFIKNLSEKYPEKALILLDIPISSRAFEIFITSNNITIDIFDPISLKQYYDSKDFLEENRKRINNALKTARAIRNLKERNDNSE